jgi:hypothetical protein
MYRFHYVDLDQNQISASNKTKKPPEMRRMLTDFGKKYSLLCF